MLANRLRKPRIVNMHEAKTHLSALVEAAERGEVITIARDGQPAVTLVPVGRARGRAPTGMYRGRLRVEEGFNDPLPSEFSGVVDE